MVVMIENLLNYSIVLSLDGFVRPKLFVDSLGADIHCY